MLKAKAKCARAEYTSDLNYDFEGKRQIKKKRFFDENDFEDNIVEKVVVSPRGRQLLYLPKKQVRLHKIFKLCFNYYVLYPHYGRERERESFYVCVMLY